MAFVAVGAVVAGSVASAAISSSAASKASAAQIAGANAAQQIQYNEFQTEQSNEKPYMDAGNTALQTLSTGFAANGAFTKTFNQSDLQNSPGYQYQLSQGQNAITAGAAARGMSLSPATLEALNQNAQGLAATNYQQQYNNFNTDMNRQIAGQEDIAQIGQNAVSGVNAAGTHYADAASSDVMSAANSRAAADVAQGNAWSGAVSNITNAAVTGYTGGLSPSTTAAPAAAAGGGYGTGAGSALNDPNYFTAASAAQVPMQQPVAY